MAVTVSITMPGSMPVSMPFNGMAQASDNGGVNIEAAWYQIDGSDAVAIEVPAPQPGVGLLFMLDGISPGDHVLSVYARTNADVNFADHNFTVNAPGGGTVISPPLFP